MLPHEHCLHFININQWFNQKLNFKHVLQLRSCSGFLGETTKLIDLAEYYLKALPYFWSIYNNQSFNQKLNFKHVLQLHAAALDPSAEQLKLLDLAEYYLKALPWFLQHLHQPKLQPKVELQTRSSTACSCSGSLGKTTQITRSSWVLPKSIAFISLVNLCIRFNQKLNFKHVLQLRTVASDTEWTVDGLVFQGGG